MTEDFDWMIDEILSVLKRIYFNFDFDVQFNRDKLKDPEKLENLVDVLDEAYEIFTKLSGSYLKMEDD